MPSVAVLLLLSGALLVSGCATRINGPQPERETSTNITEGGLKFFIYRWVWQDEESFGSVDASALSNNRGSHFQPGSFYYRERDFVEEAEAWLEQTGYCRDGYFELSRYYDVAGARLRGECKDLATDKDRERFGA